MRNHSNRPLPGRLGLMTPLRMCAFGGGGGGESKPPPPPAPPAPPRPAAATESSRTILAKLMPKRTRASTILTGGPATSGTTTKTVLGSPIAG